MSATRRCRPEFSHSRRWFGGLGLILGWTLLVVLPAHAGYLNLAWDAPTTNVDGSTLTDLKEYRVYAGTSSPPPCPGPTFVSVPSPIPNPSGETITYRLTGLTDNILYFVKVTAVDFSENESACSNEASGVDNPDGGASGGGVSGGVASTGGISSGGGGGGGCFIATAAYGSPLAPQVQLLREVRDRFLVQHPIGSAFVGFYNKASPPMAAIIAKSETLRTLARGALLPLLWWAAVMLWSPLVGLGGPLFVLALGGWIACRGARSSI